MSFLAANKGYGVDVLLLRNDWIKKVVAIFDEATLSIPENVIMKNGGKEGKHTEHLEEILTEMQFLQRTYPNSEW